MTTRHPPGYEELCGTLTQSGCAVCRVVVAAVALSVDRLLYESTLDVILRERLRAARGFCHAHALHLKQCSGSSLSIAIIYHDALGALLAALPEGSRGRASGNAGKIARDLGSQEICPVCQYQHEMERLYLDALLGCTADTGLWGAFQSSAGLCVPHLQQALGRARSTEVVARLVEAQRGCWERLRGELAEFIRKNDYRFRDEGFGAEGDSWLRVLDAAAGSEGLG